MSVQNEYNLLKREAEQDVLPECKRLGLAFLPYFPLASGLLTGKYRKGKPMPEGTRIANNPSRDHILGEANLTEVEALAQFAESRGHTILQLAFSWLLAKPVVASVIAGAMSPEQVKANAQAYWKMSSAEVDEVEAILSKAESHPAR